jgi:molybdopterin converting factor subunit 1
MRAARVSLPKTLKTQPHESHSYVRINVKLFAVARQRIGANTIDVELPATATILALRGALVEQFPALTDVIPHIRFAVNSEYAADATTISPHSEIALIPPVSGG